MFPNSIFKLPNKPFKFDPEFYQVSSSEQFLKLLKNSDFIQFLNDIQATECIQHINLIHNMNDDIVEKLHSRFFDESITFISPYLKCMLLVSSILGRSDCTENQILIVISILLSENIELYDNFDKCISKISINSVSIEDIEEQITIPYNKYVDKLNVFILNDLYPNVTINNNNNVLLYNNGIVNKHYSINNVYKFAIMIGRGSSIDNLFILHVLLKDIYKEHLSIYNQIVDFIETIKQEKQRYKSQYAVYSESIINDYLRNKYVFFDEVMEYLRVHPELSY